MPLSIIRPRQATAAASKHVNPVLAKGEIFLEVPNTGIGTGEGSIKVGDGTTEYNNLPYFFNLKTINDLKEKDIVIDVALRGYSESIDRINQTIGTINTSIEGINSQLQTIGTDISNLKDKTANIDQLSNSISSLSSTVSELEPLILHVETLKTLPDAVESLRDKVTKLDSLVPIIDELTNYPTELENIKLKMADVDQLKLDVQKIKQDIESGNISPGPGGPGTPGPNLGDEEKRRQFKPQFDKIVELTSELNKYLTELRTPNVTLPAGDDDDIRQELERRITTLENEILQKLSELIQTRQDKLNELKNTSDAAPKDIPNEGDFNAKKLKMMGEVTKLESAIIDKLKSDIRALQTGINAIDGGSKEPDLSTPDEVFNNKFIILSNRVKELQNTTLTKLQDDIRSKQTLLNELKSETTQPNVAIPEEGTFDTKKEALVGRITELETNILAEKDKIVKALAKEVTDISGVTESDDTTSIVGDYKTKLALYNNKISEINAKILPAISAAITATVNKLNELTGGSETADANIPQSGTDAFKKQQMMAVLLPLRGKVLDHKKGIITLLQKHSNRYKVIKGGSDPNTPADLSVTATKNYYGQLAELEARVTTNKAALLEEVRADLGQEIMMELFTHRELERWTHQELMGDFFTPYINGLN